jgi:hypothetical protein
MITMVRDALVLESMRVKGHLQRPDAFIGPLGDHLWSIVVDFAYDGGRLMDAILEYPDFDPEEREDTACFMTNSCQDQRNYSNCSCLTHLRTVHILNGHHFEAWSIEAIRSLLEAEDGYISPTLMPGFVRARGLILDNARSQKMKANHAIAQA